MLYKTEGIVFYTSDYGNTSIIAKVYTQQFGLQSYIVNSVRSAKGKNKIIFFQPLSLVNMVVYHKAAKGLQRISDISFSHQFTSIPFSIIKTSLALFITEILYRSIKEEESNEELFHFIQTSVLFLDAEENNFQNFHLLFLLKLATHLGFKPNGTYNTQTTIFNLSEGVFQPTVPPHPYFIQQDAAQLFSKLCMLSYQELKNINVSKPIRDDMIETLLLFYNLHLPSGFKIQSHLILKEVMS